MFDERTLYTILDEHGERTTITLDKRIADALQAELPDVHAWIQATYYRVDERKPELGRRQKGDMVRLIAERQAEKSPNYVSLLQVLM